MFSWGFSCLKTTKPLKKETWEMINGVVKAKEARVSATSNSGHVGNTYLSLGMGVKGLEVRIFLLDFSLGSFGFWKRGNNNVHLVKDATISLKLTTEALGLLGIQRRSLLERERYRKIPRRDN